MLKHMQLLKMIYNMLYPKERVCPTKDKKYYVNLSKEERKNLSFEEQQELRKYKAALKRMQEESLNVK